MKPTNTEAYLEQLPADQRKALEQLRKQILAVAPGAEDGFGYGLPAFKYNGHPLVYMGAAKNHCALYGSVPVGFKERLKDFTVSKGTIQFTPDRSAATAARSPGERHREGEVRGDRGAVAGEAEKDSCA
jgi:uncharacterized protein YdhG (YjbR/CyaY superfamily)